MYQAKKPFVAILAVSLLIPFLLIGCRDHKGSAGTNEDPPVETETPPVPGTSDDPPVGTQTPSVISGIRSAVLSDTDNIYPTGRTIRIDVDAVDGIEKIASGTIRITSGSQGYDSGVQDLQFGSIFYLWDTTGLLPGLYNVTIVLVDADNETSSDSSLSITLVPNPPVINKLVSEVDISVPAQGFPVTVTRSYLLDSTFDGPMGYGWSHSYRMRAVETKTNIINASFQLVPVDGVVQIFNADGTGSYFQPNEDGSYQSPKGDFRTLTKNADGTYALRGKSGTSFQFDAVGRLTSIQDRNGNLQTLAYGSNGRVFTITDGSNQITTFTYNGDNRITSITDPLGKTVSYSYDSVGNLVSVTDNGGGTTTYAYDDDHNLTKITDPAGRQTFFTSDSEDRLASVSGAGGENSLSYQYGVPSPDKMTVTDALGQETVLTYDTNASITQVTDPSGKTTSMTYDANLNLTSLADANGGVTSFSYDARGNVLSTTDAEGNVVTLSYEPQFNQVTSLTDAKGNTTAFAYDASGNLTTMTYPGGATESFGYDAVGNLTSKTDRKTQTITFTYDGAGRLTQKTFPDNTSDTYSYGAVANREVV